MYDLCEVDFIGQVLSVVLGLINNNNVKVNKIAWDRGRKKMQ